MSQQFSEQVKYTFHDVSAYFSEEEWKLLHHWQKELYGNVMKEIHQALISLGPLIATTVFSLRAKEEQELVPMDNQDSETRHRIPNSPSEVITNPDAVFRINREETLCLKNSQDTEGREENDCISTGFPFLNTDICLRKEEPLSIFIDHLGMEVTEHSTSPIAGHEVVSFHVKDEEEPYCMDTQDSRRVESTSSPAGNGRISRKNKGDALKCTKTPPPSKVVSGKAKVSVLQSAEKRINSRSQPRSEVSQYLEEEKMTPCKSGFRNPTYSGLHKGIAKMETVDKCNASVNNQRNAKHLTYQRNTKLKWAWYKCTECDKGFRQNIDLIRHIRTHTGERPYQCTKCEKRFSRSSNLFRHQRTHTGERPYQCTTCEQSFSQKGHLILHQKTHMGKKETSPKLTGRETVNWTTEG